MNFSQQTESATDRTKLFMENNPSLMLKAELLLSWLKDVGDLDEDATLDDLIFGGDYYDMDKFIVEGTEYAVGDEDEVRKSCEESIKDQIYSEGLQVFNKDFLKSYVIFLKKITPINKFLLNIINVVLGFNSLSNVCNDR